MQQYIKGSSPKLILHSGTHGDECEIIESVKKAVTKFEDKLPDFVFVPEVSPSAVKSRTRTNARGVDINREFYADSADLEVKSNMEIFQKYPAPLLVSFHEDAELAKDLYIYDCGSLKGTELIKSYLRSLPSLGVFPYNGVDDRDDPSLGSEFKDGYRFFPVLARGKDDGMIPTWVLARELVEKVVVIEIPGKAKRGIKDDLVDLFFSTVLLGFVYEPVA